MAVKHHALWNLFLCRLMEMPFSHHVAWKAHGPTHKENTNTSLLLQTRIRCSISLRNGRLMGEGPKPFSNRMVNGTRALFLWTMSFGATCVCVRRMANSSAISRQAVKRCGEMIVLPHVMAWKAYGHTRKEDALTILLLWVHIQQCIYLRSSVPMARQWKPYLQSLAIATWAQFRTEASIWATYVYACRMATSSETFGERVRMHGEMIALPLRRMCQLQNATKQISLGQNLIPIKLVPVAI
mmetsp:Transcript_9359/g.17091  ORF Transcript_9359/g.17091 Transcript_9359/m.17091 type:complete len:241 (+) Transcript_9359:221-943(+)